VIRRFNLAFRLRSAPVDFGFWILISIPQTGGAPAFAITFNQHCRLALSFDRLDNVAEFGF
jgi:hypothetical protein